MPCASERDGGRASTSSVRARHLCRSPWGQRRCVRRYSRMILPRSRMQAVLCPPSTRPTPTTCSGGHAQGGIGIGGRCWEPPPNSALSAATATSNTSTTVTTNPSTDTVNPMTSATGLSPIVSGRRLDSTRGRSCPYRSVQARRTPPGWWLHHMYHALPRQATAFTIADHSAARRKPAGCRIICTTNLSV